MDRRQKQEELQPHPVKDQLPNISYCITSPPPWPEAILLGFQHYLVMLGTAVLIPTYLVPQMGGGNEEKAKMIQTILFVTGLNTLQQTFFGTRLPAVIGASYTYVPTTISIILAGRYSDLVNPQEKFEKIMRGTQGALIVASILQIVVGFSGLWRNVARYASATPLPPAILSCGIGWQGVGILFSGIFGTGNGSSVSVENAHKEFIYREEILWGTYEFDKCASARNEVNE